MGSGAVTGQKFMGGSSWSSCYVYETASGKSFFVKLAMGRSAAEMFEGEALGLQAMHGKYKTITFNTFRRIKSNTALYIVSKGGNCNLL